jgi:hypothetical protein
MARYDIYAGLGGGFGGATLVGTEEHDTKDEAILSAYSHAREAYESYEGLYGLRTLEQIMKEDGIDDPQDAFGIYTEEVESWIDYYVKEEE